MNANFYADLSAVLAFIAVLAVAVGFLLAFLKRHEDLVLGVSFDSVLPLFANDHHRRDFDILTERWIDARIWMRKQGRLSRDRAPAVPSLVARKPRLRVA